MLKKISTILIILSLLLSTSPIQALMCNTDSETCETASVSDLCLEDTGSHSMLHMGSMGQDETLQSAVNDCCCVIQTSPASHMNLVVPLLPGHDPSKTIVGFNDTVEAFAFQTGTDFSLNIDPTTQAFPPKLYLIHASYLI